MNDSEKHEKAGATDRESHKHNNPIFHHIELLLFEALQLNIKDEVETLMTEHFLSQKPIAGAKAQNPPESYRAYPHPLATLIAPFVETALHEQAPRIVADILRQQNNLSR